MQTNITPEIYEAMRASSAVAHRLAAESFAADEDLRAELAAETLAAAELMPAPLATAAVRVAADLADAAADFDDWDARLALSLRMDALSRSLEQGVF